MNKCPTVTLISGFTFYPKGFFSSWSGYVICEYRWCMNISYPSYCRINCTALIIFVQFDCSYSLNTVISLNSGHLCNTDFSLLTGEAASWQDTKTSMNLQQPAPLIPPVHPDVQMKPLPFYDVLDVLIKPSSLGPWCFVSNLRHATYTYWNNVGFVRDLWFLFKEGLLFFVSKVILTWITNFSMWTVESLPGVFSVMPKKEHFLY